MRSSFWITAAVVFSIGHFSHVASAQTAPDASHDAEARALFEAGRVAFSDGRFEDALAHFQRSYDLSGRPQLLYNIGATHDRLRHDREAVEAFDRYLALVPEADNRREVDGRLRLLREALARQDAEARTHASEPVATAAAAPTPIVVTSSRSEPTDHDDNVLGAWWFWAIVGVVAVGAVAGIIVATQVSAGDRHPDYALGTDGTIAFTLTAAMP